MKFIGIIPARYASTRFPGKPLALLGGKPIIQHVYEQVKRCIDDVWVATDDQRIIDVVSAFGGKAIMTSDSHKSGTDRIHEAADLVKTDADVIINIQGDEPFIAKEQIETICQCFDDSRTQIATLAKPFEKDINLIRNFHSYNYAKFSLTNNNETEGGGVEGDEIVVEEAAEAAVVGKLAWCADIQLVVLFHEP